jgi:hypothetical protein
MADAYGRLKVGPALSDLDVGPVVSRRQKDIVEGYIGLAERDGARLAAQGTIVPEAPAGGAYVKATLIRDVSPSHRLVQEEIFGPVQVIMPFDGEQQAIDLANGTPTALFVESGPTTADGNSVWRAAFTRDRSSSTITAPAAESNCRSAASSVRATAARRALKPSTALQRPRRFRSITAEGTRTPAVRYQMLVSTG